MAMKIGGEYLLDKIFPRHFEQLVEEAGLAKPLVKSRVSELATRSGDFRSRTNHRGYCGSAKWSLCPDRNVLYFRFSTTTRPAAFR